jgi:hypothetical protein
MSRIFVTSFVFTLFLFPSPISMAKVLFLAHWNETLTANVAAGKAGPVIANGTQPPKIGDGYPFKDSMPAINGLAIGADSNLAYETAGNMNAAEGTLDFWFYPRAEFVPSSGVIPHLFSVNLGPGSDHRWANAMFMTYGGWKNNLSLVITDDKAKWGSSVGYLAEKWGGNNRWHRIAVSWSAKNKRLSMFIDGRLESRSENAKLLPSFLPCLYIGSNRGWQGFAQHNYDEFRILDREIGEVEAAADYCRKYEFTKDDSFRPESLMVPIDISKVATRPFEDEEANDKKGGWTDQGSNDMRFIPRGNVQVLGMPFKIANGCIALANAQKQYFPQEATIDINARYGGLLFIHTSAWMMAPDKTCGYYVIKYADGTKQSVPLESFKNIGDWWEQKQLSDARPVLSHQGGGSGALGSYLFFWQNPTPEKPIKSLLFKTTNDEAMPILIAITGVKPEASSDLYEGIKLLTHYQVDLAGEFAQTAKKFKEMFTGVEGLRKKLAEIKLSEKELSSFYGREAARHLSEAWVYLREIDALKPNIEDAIKKNRVREFRTIEKALSYIYYIEEIEKLIPGLREKARKTVAMAPLSPVPFQFPAQAAELFTKFPRTEIVLNGTWEVNNADDPVTCGSVWKPIQVPVTDYGEKSSWLRKSVAIPAQWAGRKIELWFECCRAITEVYVNRQFVGRHIGIEPFGMDLSKKIVPGAANEILLFVGSKEYLLNDYNKGITHIVSSWELSAISQDVFLRVSPRTCLTEPYARIDASNNFILTGKVENPLNLNGLELEVNLPSHRFGRFKINPDINGFFQITSKWEKPILWGIGGQYGEPHLVQVGLKLFGKDSILDETSFRTGFRHFEIRDKVFFYLNGKKIILQGDHLWSQEGHASCSTRAFMTRYYRLAREANFNFVRLHFIDGGNIQPQVLDTADELGFLVEPEAALTRIPSLRNEEMNFDDPVLRINAETYFRAFAKKVRTHPNVVIFSLSNEVFQVAGRHLDDASKFYLNMERIVKEEMPNVVLTEQGNNWRKEFATADVHYSGGVAFKNWDKRGDKPLIHGEWSFYEGGYFAMNLPDPVKAKTGMKYAAQSFEREIKLEIASGAAGTMPFPAFMICTFCTADERVMGPWAKEILAAKPWFNPSRWYLPGGRGVSIPITWPALSGKGVKVIYNYTGTQADNINFFDPTRKEFTPNEVYFAFKRAFTPMPPLRPVINPEVIVTVNKEEQLLPVWAVSPKIPILIGTMPDTEGKAWFELPADGDYTFTVIDRTHLKEKPFKATCKPLAQPPGFNYVDKLDLKN